MSAANEFERKYVHEFYDWKALSTRRGSAKWRKVEEFLLSFEVGACIADIGKIFIIFFYGIDILSKNDLRFYIFSLWF